MEVIWYILLKWWKCLLFSNHKDICFVTSFSLDIFRVSDADGSLDMEDVDGDISKDKLTTDAGMLYLLLYIYFYIDSIVKKKNVYKIRL